MKRLILFLGLIWALIYTANHTVFLRASSNLEAKVTTHPSRRLPTSKYTHGGHIFRTSDRHFPAIFPLSLNRAKLERLLGAKLKPTLHLQPRLLPRRRHRNQSSAPMPVAMREKRPRLITLRGRF